MQLCVQYGRMCGARVLMMTDARLRQSTPFSTAPSAPKVHITPHCTISHAPPLPSAAKPSLPPTNAQAEHPGCTPTPHPLLAPLPLHPPPWKKPTSSSCVRKASWPILTRPRTSSGCRERNNERKTGPKRGGSESKKKREGREEGGRRADRQGRAGRVASEGWSVQGRAGQGRGTWKQRPAPLVFMLPTHLQRGQLHPRQPLHHHHPPRGVLQQRLGDHNLAGSAHVAAKGKGAQAGRGGGGGGRALNRRAKG